MMADQRVAIVRTEGIGRRYGGLQAVADFSFEIFPEEILGLIGPNGAGKSTTFNLISGFVKPTSGRLYFGDKDVTGWSATRISRMGLVRTFQHGSLMKSLTVRDNIVVGVLGAVGLLRTRSVQNKVQDAARMLGLEPYLDEVSGNLPHGIQRLVSIAIAYAANPKVLCLDEPLTGLNQTEASETLNLLRRIRDNQKCAILLVEHNMKAVMQLCERIVVLHHGQMLAMGTPSEIRSNPAVITAYLGEKHARS